jgi:ornithine cyclodeaminase/alanine dehydrogenase-like protein (mu-crystallin family)
MLEKAGQARVATADSLGAAVEGADLVISAVTASSSADVARWLADALVEPGK